jgi:uncharacterized membrane protein YphA (DoxX/SURF4 family)
MVDDIPLLVPLLARIVLGAVFLVAAAEKLRDPDGFTRALANYTPIPAPVRSVTATVLPGVELILGVWLASGFFAEAAAAVAIVSLAAFGAVAIWSFGNRPADCGCLGSLLKGGTGYRIALRNLGLAALATPVIFIAEGLAPVASLALGAAGASLLAATALLVLSDGGHRHAPSHVQDRPSATPMGRRTFLSRAALLGSAVAGLGLGLGRLGKAEAACSYCGSCSPTYLFIVCTDNCCGFFWTRRMKYCESSCYSCSAWTQVEICGISACC